MPCLIPVRSGMVRGRGIGVDEVMKFISLVISR